MRASKIRAPPDTTAPLLRRTCPGQQAMDDDADGDDGFFRDERRLLRFSDRILTGGRLETKPSRGGGRAGWYDAETNEPFPDKQLGVDASMQRASKELPVGERDEHFVRHFHVRQTI